MTNQVAVGMQAGRGPLRAINLALVLWIPAGVLAQTSDAPAEPGAPEIEEIVVTGSLLQRNGFDAPTPVTVLGADDLARVAAPNIADAINQMPALRPSLTPASTTNAAGLAGQSFLDLRGLGYQRTQVLVDGRRYVPTVAAGGVSISSIPQALIRSVDIVTGGASATYGSDAVAGVVNLRIDDKFEGLRGTLQGGLTNHDDYGNYLVSPAYGRSFSGGRGHVVMGVEFSENVGIDRVGDRDWGARNYQLINNPAYTATNAEPRLILTDNVIYSNVSYGGVINSPGPLHGYQFAADGTPVPFQYGDLVSASTMRGGDGALTTADGILVAPVERHSAFGRVTYDLTDHVAMFAEAAYNQTKSDFLGLASVDQITIHADNAYLPASVRDMMGNTIPSFVMGKSINDNSRIQNHSDVQTYQVTSGLNGEFGEGWSWDVFYSYGRTDNRLDFSNARISSRFLLAADAVVDPATNAIVCRSTLTDPANGCVPVNLFGIGRASPEALAWVNGSGFNRTELTRHETAGTLRGMPFSLPAGSVSVAVGAEYRRQAVDVTSDPLAATARFRGNSLVPYSGEVEVKEAFGEALVPLLSNARWAKKLSVNVAARVTDYSTSGTVTTWKGGADDAINDTVRLRVTRSRDIRAPSLSELFAAGSISNLIINNDPATNQTYLVATASTGNPDLEPEEADTLTAGLVLTPQFAPGFVFSVDYYDIDLENAIISLTPQAILDQCARNNQQACSLITRGAGGLVTTIANVPVNLQSVRERGVDFDLSYGLPVGPGDLSLRALVNYVDTLTLQNGPTVTVLDGSVDQPAIAAVGGTPHVRFNVAADYKTDAYRVSLTARYVGGGEINTAYTAKDINIRSISGRLYFDFSGELPLGRSMDDKSSLFVGVQNLLDKDPPITGVGGYGTTRSLYDVIGRVYSAGLRFNF
ncbi:TonB-dependent receptor domain-containing protein [Peristeroidobacter soli]|uniref:TonB-dependent receptor domain-containing protein n=1 Tax=Peristeroidobacter soli TaxID=2497877 RepID=UPI00101C0600|nr:TonB-dependent receptor [Peristeroidobacter soli]